MGYVFKANDWTIRGKEKPTGAIGKYVFEFRKTKDHIKGGHNMRNIKTATETKAKKEKKLIKTALFLTPTQ